MVELDSILFSFTRVDNFLKLLINTEDLTTDLFDGVSNNFKLVLAESCPSNIDECLTAENTLDEDKISFIYGDEDYDGECALTWQDGVNGDATISLANSTVNYALDDNTYMLKAAFLVVATGSAAGVVLAYSINNAPMMVQKQIIMPMDSMVWRIANQIDGV